MRVWRVRCKNRRRRGGLIGGVLEMGDIVHG